MKFLTNYFTNILMNFDFSVDFSLTYYLLTVASFRIGVPSILFYPSFEYCVKKWVCFYSVFRSHLSTWLSYTKLMKSKKELRDLEKQKEKSSAKVGQFLLNLQTLKKQLEQEKSSTSLKTTSNSRRTTPCSHRLESVQDLNFQVGHQN